MKTYIVDSFTGLPFRGNPAGVCLVEAELTDDIKLLVAQELGLSETAFVKPTESGTRFEIRYFSPKMEIPLCGHATLAAAKVLFKFTGVSELHFMTRQGLDLPVSLMADDGAITMEFPAYGTEPSAAPPKLLAALGLDEVNNVAFNKETQILLLEIESPRVLAKLAPDFEALHRSHQTIHGVLVTAPSPDDGAFDFHSRYFWPWSGTNEDPVTGGTHTFLAPYWSERLGKSRLTSFQSSARGGCMAIELLDGKMLIRSQAVIVLEGRLNLT